jgi:hypothetical protein
MWISLDVLDAALVNLCEFKVLILLRCLVHKRYHFTPSFHSILLLINEDIKMISKYCGEGNNNRRQYTRRHGGAVLIANVKQVKYYYYYY